jgi:hypothetical protein
MHVPSSDIYPQLLVEPAGIWFVPARGSDSHAILLKSPSNILKALTKGASIKLGFSVKATSNGKVLMSVMYIEDEKDAPIITISEHVQHFQQVALVEILSLRTRTPIFFYDELARNIAEAECEFDGNKENVINLIGNINDLYVGEPISDVIRAMNYLEGIAEGVITNSPLALEQIVVTELTLNQFKEFDLYTVGLREVGRFGIADKDEGGGLEQSVWHLFEGLFQHRIYRSPQLVKMNKIRELTDILATSDNGVFLIESKVRAVLNTSKDQSASRRAKNIETQIKKALRQLAGAVKSIQQGLQIVTRDGQEIEINRELLPHAIVLLSEMYPAIDSKTITIELFKTQIESKAMFHILDLRDLAMLVGMSKTVNLFDYYLMQRAEEVVNMQNAVVRTRFIKG